MEPAPPPLAMFCTYIVVDAVVLLGIASDALTCALCVRCVYISHIGFCYNTENRSSYLWLKRDLIRPDPEQGVSGNRKKP